MSTCAKCGGSSFRIATNEPRGSRYKLNFVECGGCGSPVGVIDYFNTGAQLEEQKQQIAQLERKIDHLDHLLRQIAQRIR
jgi:hypothetical protein